MTMEDDKFQDLQGESQQETQETQKASRRSLCLSLSPKAGKSCCSISKAGGIPIYLWEGQTFCCSAKAFNWLDEAHPH